MAFRNPITTVTDDYARTLAERAAADATRAISDAAAAAAAAEAAEATATEVSGAVLTAQNAADAAAADALAALTRAQEVGVTATDAQALADAAQAAADAAAAAAGAAGTDAATADAKAAQAAADAAQAIADAAAAKKETDTGAPTGPGARLYQETFDGGERGVVEFRTGIAGDEPARMALTSYQQTFPDGSIRSYGTELEVRGAGSNGAPPARMLMTVQEAPAGGYESVLTMEADRSVLPGPRGLVARGASTAGVQLGTAAEGRVTGAQNLTGVRLEADREYEAEWVGNLNAGGTAGRITLNVRVGRGATPDTASPIAATAAAWIAIVGGPGQETVTTGGQPFRVGASRSDYELHTFVTIAGGAGATAGVVPPMNAANGGVHVLTVRDVGPAQPSTRQIY